MLELLSITLLALIAAVLVLVAANMAFWPRPRRRSEGPSGHVSVLIPARDEEAHLPGCLDAVLKQGDAVSEVLVYNDHSSDGTGAVIAAYAARDGRVRAVAPMPLPTGWCGKNFACHQLAQHAAGDWLLFLDADARLEPGAVDALVAEATRRQATFLSPWPGLVLNSFWEKACMPLLNFAVFTLFPAPVSLKDMRPSMGLAHGACLLMERDAYGRVGGHEAVKDEIFEDTCLARLWRERGERGVCLDGQDIVRVRMYASLPEIWAGFMKNFYPAFRRETSFWLFLLFHAVLFWFPFGLLIATIVSGQSWWPAAGAAGLVLAMRGMMALRFRYSLWTAALHPLTHAMFLVLGLHSRWRCASGAGVTWKGRSYRSAAEEAQP